MINFLVDCVFTAFKVGVGSAIISMILGTIYLIIMVLAGVLGLFKK